jgi:hypothetical protein
MKFAIWGNCVHTGFVEAVVESKMMAIHLIESFLS